MNKRDIGSQYELLAEQYLKEKGYEILEKNYRVRSGEIDIIARDGRYLVFLEVKYRSSQRNGTALEAVNYHKQQVIMRTARVYLHQHRYPEGQPCRFDVIGITKDQIQHVKNAFGGF